MRTLRNVLPALLVLVGVTAALTLVENGTLAVVTERYGLLVYGVAALLAAVFHRSRVVIAAAGLAYLEHSRADLSGTQAFALLATALLGLLGALAVSRDRGVRSRVGLLQVAATLGVLVLAHQLLEDPVLVTELGAVSLLPSGLTSRIGLTDVGTVGAALGLLLGCFAVARRHGPVERGLLGTQALLLIASLPVLAPSESSTLLMGAGLLLAFSVVEQSYSMAYRDELTKLPGRRALMRELAELSPPFTVGMVDVDHFKKFNDQHGHDVGDQVLQLVATHLADARDATAYRYGGEEFTLVFHRLTQAEALAGAESVRMAIENATFSLRRWNRPRKRPAATKAKKPKKRPRTLSVTVSIGLAGWSSGDGSPEAILKRADQALYRAKENGRNRVAT